MSYTFTDASNLMIRDDEITNKYDILIDILVDKGIIYKCKSHDPKYNDKYLLDRRFEYFHNKESELYFDKHITQNGFYQLRITEEGVKHLLGFIDFLDREGEKNEQCS